MIKDWLTRGLGEHSVFRDVDSIRAGKDFRQELDAAVGKCKVMLAIIGATWLKRSRLLRESKTKICLVWCRSAQTRASFGPSRSIAVLAVPALVVHQALS